VLSSVAVDDGGFMRSAKSPNSYSRKDPVYHARSSFLKHSAHAATDKRGESVSLNGSTSSAHKAPSVQAHSGYYIKSNPSKTSSSCFSRLVLFQNHNKTQPNQFIK
jgi:hypothetical protein